MASNINQHNQLLALFAIYTKKLDKLYYDFVKKLIKTLPLSEDEVWERLADDPLFRFNDFPDLRKRLESVFDDYVSNQVLCYKQGITDGVALAFSQDAINLGKYTILQDEAIKAARNASVTSFIANRMSRKEGLSLSDKVWNYSQLGKSEVEMGISNVIKDGLKAGTSAEELGRKVRQYLNNPTMMYRRYWVTVADSNGNKKKVARWYHKHIDPDTGKVTFKDEPLEKVGSGVYRSARMNGYRLMRTEINMSYHNANNERWQNEPFVYGIRIWMSPQHPVPDICDDLAGDYPKDFKFTSWHPNCLCAASPLTISGEEKKDFYRRLMKGEDMSNFHSKNEITEANMNPDWKKYIEQQHDKIISAAERGKLAYHLRDNQKYWIGNFSEAERKKMGLLPNREEEAAIKKAETLRKAKERQSKRTPEEIKRIQDDWDWRRILLYEQKCDNAKAVLKDTMSPNNHCVALTRRLLIINNAIRNHATVAEVEALFARYKHGVEVQQAWDKMLWRGLSKEQIENCHKIEKELNILKGRQMTYEAANTGKENPNYLTRITGYLMNCQTCTPVHYLRRLGFNVEAYPNTAGTALDVYANLQKAKVEWTERFLNADMTAPDYDFITNWAARNNYKNITVSRLGDYLSEKTSADGLYEIYGRWKKGDAHVFLAERVGDKLRFFDPQSGQQDVTKYISQMRTDGVGVIRLNDKIINPEIIRLLFKVK